jgi:hypothetical protein
MSFHTCRSGHLIVTLALACGPQAPAVSATDGGGASTDLATTAASTDVFPTTSSTSTTDPSTSTTDSTSADPTFVFIHDPDEGGVDGCTTDRARKRCDPWVQDCPAHEKCIAYDGTCDGQWDAMRCAEVVRDPAVAGEPCTVEKRPASGRDDCDFGSMCWNVDPDTLQGTCAAFCDGSPDNPLCPPGTACLIAFDGTVPLCLPVCDPLQQNCPAGEVCVDAVSGPQFVCTRSAPGVPAELHQPCERFDACAPGLFCAYQKPAACGPEPGGCCVGFCDITLQDCPAPQQCQSWFDMQPPPPGLENVGGCAD